MHWPHLHNTNNKEEGRVEVEGKTESSVMDTHHGAHSHSHMQRAKRQASCK